MLNELVNMYSFQVVKSDYSHLCLRQTASSPAPFVYLGEVSAFTAVATNVNYTETREGEAVCLKAELI